MNPVEIWKSANKNAYLVMKKYGVIMNNNYPMGDAFDVWITTKTYFQNVVMSWDTPPYLSVKDKKVESFQFRDVHIDMFIKNMGRQLSCIIYETYRYDNEKKASSDSEKAFKEFIDMHNPL